MVQANLKLTSILIMTSIGIFLISQSSAAFAGVCGGDGDPDGDCVFGSGDNCPNVYNPGQEDVNMDGIGDACISPSELVEDVIEVVEITIEDISELSPAQINSLVGKLESAADKLDDNQLNGAIGSLNASINQIQAFINSGEIPQEEGESLINAIQMVIDAID